MAKKRTKNYRFFGGHSKEEMYGRKRFSTPLSDDTFSSGNRRRRRKMIALVVMNLVVKRRFNDNSVVSSWPWPKTLLHQRGKIYENAHSFVAKTLLRFGHLTLQALAHHVGSRSHNEKGTRAVHSKEHSTDGRSRYEQLRKRCTDYHRVVLVLKRSVL